VEAFTLQTMNGRVLNPMEDVVEMRSGKRSGFHRGCRHPGCVDGGNDLDENTWHMCDPRAAGYRLVGSRLRRLL